MIVTTGGSSRVCSRRRGTRAFTFPSDFSLVAITASQFAGILTPALTSVEWPAFEAGKLAAEMLIRRLAGGEDPPTQILIRHELTARESTASPPAPRD